MAWFEERSQRCVMKQGGRGLAGGGSARLRNTLAGIELALATVLLIGAGLLIQESSPGFSESSSAFHPMASITFQLAPPTTKIPSHCRGAAAALPHAA